MRAFGKLVFAVGIVGVVRTRGQAPIHATGDGDDEIEREAALTDDQIRGVHGKIDADGNGKVSLEEVMRFSDSMRKVIAAKDVAAVLESMDGDNDGKLSLDELMQDMQEWAQENEEEGRAKKDARMEVEKLKFKAADKDGDGILDKEELPALFFPETHEGVMEITAKHALEAKDQDADGKLSPEEFWEGDVMDGDASALSEEEKGDFKKLDTNGDGFLDLQELKEWESGRFHTAETIKKLLALADKDSDMHVSAEELAAAREHIAGSDAQYQLMEWAEKLEL